MCPGRSLQSQGCCGEQPATVQQQGPHVCSIRQELGQKLQSFRCHSLMKKTSYSLGFWTKATLYPAQCPSMWMWVNLTQITHKWRTVPKITSTRFRGCAPERIVSACTIQHPSDPGVSWLLLSTLADRIMSASLFCLFWILFCVMTKCKHNIDIKIQICTQITKLKMS